MHVYEVRPRSDKRGFDLISDALPFGRLWCCEVKDAIDLAKFSSRSHDAVIKSAPAPLQLSGYLRIRRRMAFGTR